MEKAREFNVPLYMAFIDKKTTLWSVLERMSVSGPIVTQMKKLYAGREAAVRVDGEFVEIKWFPVSRGVSPVRYCRASFCR